MAQGSGNPINLKQGVVIEMWSVAHSKREIRQTLKQTLLAPILTILIVGGGIETANIYMKVNKRYNKAVREAMTECRDEIIGNIVSLLKECFCSDPERDRTEVLLNRPVYYLDMEKTRGTVQYTPKMADRIGVAGLYCDKAARLIVIEGPATFSPLEWLDLTTLGRVFAELLATAKVE